MKSGVPATPSVADQIVIDTQDLLPTDEAGIKWKDITDEVEKAVLRSGVREGLVGIHTLHATTALVLLNESLDTDTHPRSLLLGGIGPLVVAERKIRFGEWRKIHFYDLDSLNRLSRTVVVRVLGTR